MRYHHYDVLWGQALLAGQCADAVERRGESSGVCLSLLSMLVTMLNRRFGFHLRHEVGGVQPLAGSVLESLLPRHRRAGGEHLLS